MRKKTVKIFCSILFLFACVVGDPVHASEKKTLSEGSMIAMGYTKLPLQNERLVLGTWHDPLFGSTISIEKFNGKSFEVSRHKDGSGGTFGKELKFAGGYFVLNNGDKYKIAEDGILAIYDGEGLVDILEKHNELWP